MKKNLLYVGFIVFSFSVFSISCNQHTTEKRKATEVHIGSFFTAVDYAPYIIAKKKGFFDEAVKNDSVKITYTTFQSLPPLNEALATKKIDIVFEAEPPAIVGKAAGIDEKILDVSCSINLGLLVSAKSDINSIKDLKGKKIALLAGTGVHYGVLKVLNNNGLQKSDVKIIDMFPPDAKSAFETGKVDAWAVWSPFIDQEELNGKGRVLPGNNFQIQSIMVVRGGFLSESPDLSAKLKGAFDKAKVWLEQNPAEAQKIVAAELGLKPEEIQRAWGRHDWKSSLSPAVIEDIQNKADFLLTEKFVEKKVDVKKDLIVQTSPAN